MSLQYNSPISVQSYPLPTFSFMRSMGSLIDRRFTSCPTNTNYSDKDIFLKVQF